MSKRRVKASATATLRVESDGDDDSFAEVLKAAESCFRQYGIKRTRMDDIAKTAGIPRPYLYRHVASKEVLAVRVQQTLTARLDEARREQIPLRGPAGVILVRAVVMGVEWMRNDPFVDDIIGLEAGKVIGTYAWGGGLTDAKIPDPDYWFPIFEYARSRGELRDDLDNEQVLRWVGAIAHLLISRPEIYPNELLEFCAENLVVPAILSESGRRALASGKAVFNQKPNSKPAKNVSSKSAKT